jgi:hypothetical protein
VLNVRLPVGMNADRQTDYKTQTVTSIMDKSFIPRMVGTVHKFERKITKQFDLTLYKVICRQVDQNAMAIWMDSIATTFPPHFPTRFLCFSKMSGVISKPQCNNV